MTSLSEEVFIEAASRELLALVAALDVLNDELDVELAGDILTIEFADGAPFVINRHGAARQIWMAADRTAWHFDWDPERKTWTAQKSNDELWSTLERVLTKKLGEPVTLARSREP